MNKKIAIITTHPIQYYAPLFAKLSENEDISFKIFFTKGSLENYSFDKEFKREIVWDVSVLENYDYEFLQNTSKTAKKGGFFSIKNPLAIEKIEYWGANAILVFGWNYESHIKIMRHFKGKIPVFFRGDSTLLDETTFLKSKLRMIFLKLIYSYIDFAFYVGKCNKNYFLMLGLKENNLLLASHCIDNDRFTNNKLNKDFRLELNIKKDEKVILFCGKFISKKNPLSLLNVFKKMNLPNSHLVFVGNGELEDELKYQSTNNKNIHFLPFQNQNTMPDVYKMANVYCLPSSGPGETWGLAINEAMACGITVVASNKCGCSEDLIIDSQTGYVFESNNEKSLENALIKALILSNKSTIFESQVDFISNYSIQNTANSMLFSFKEILKYEY